ncbi:hypothetical protein [Roseomonas populi]|uniref:hypothetical protein n=1 Tax=Roseomonas populi TaxID=3121582 RepID=UPI0038CD1438
MHCAYCGSRVGHAFDEGPPAKPYATQRGGDLHRPIRMPETPRSEAQHKPLVPAQPHPSLTSTNRPFC